MSGQDLEQLRMHERFAAHDSEETVAGLFGLADQAVHRLGLDNLLLGRHIHPASLATKITTVDDRDVDERREELAAFHLAFKPFDRQHSLEAEVVCQLPQQTFVGFKQQPFGHAQIHR